MYILGKSSVCKFIVKDNIIFYINVTHRNVIHRHRYNCNFLLSNFAFLLSVCFENIYLRKSSRQTFKVKQLYYKKKGRIGGNSPEYIKKWTIH